MPVMRFGPHDDAAAHTLSEEPGMSSDHGPREANFTDRLKALIGLHPTVGRVVVLGGPGMGKTTFWTLLQGREVGEEAIPTTVLDDSGKEVVFSAGGQQVHASFLPDAPGHADAVEGLWQALFQRAQTVFYLFHAPRLLARTRNPEEPSRLIETALDLDEHLRSVAAWQRARRTPFLRKKPIPRVVLLGSYCDQLPEHAEWVARRAELAREMQEARALRSSIARLRQEGIDPTLVLGSLAPPHRSETMRHVRERMVP